MAFRSNEYIQRNELVRFQLDDTIRSPANGQAQDKSGYKFTINDRSIWYEARRLLTHAVQNNGGGGAKNINIIY